MVLEQVQRKEFLLGQDLRRRVGWKLPHVLIAAHLDRISSSRLDIVQKPVEAAETVEGSSHADVDTSCWV